jgi:hypothetical protein
MSFPLDASGDARGALVEERVRFARVARGRVHHDEIFSPTRKSRSRAVFESPGAFSEAEKPRGRGGAREEV